MICKQTTENQARFAVSSACGRVSAVLFAFHDHIDNDRRTYQWCDGIYGNYLSVTGQRAHHIAQECDESAAQQRGRKQNAMV